MNKPKQQHFQHKNQSNNKSPSDFNGVHAPYNFVPHPNKVPPAWRQKTFIDVPFDDGVCGEIDIELSNSSALMIGGKRDANGTVSFFSLNGKPVIPGSSIRGMLRNVAEIVSFSKLQHMNNRFPTLRDIRDEFYKGQLTKDNKVVVKAGWLRFDTDSKRFELLPCEFARIKYRDIEEEFKCPKLKPLRTVEQKYAATKGFCKQINFDIIGKNGGGESIARLGNGYQGRIVFTGWASNKEKEFIFYNSSDSAEVIPSNVIRTFQAIYDKDVGDKSPLKVLNRLLKRNADVPGIPVFFTRNEGNELEYLGLAQMMKLPPKVSVGELHPTYTNSDNNLDITELLFGCIADEKDPQSYSLKSRLSFADLHCHSGECVINPVNMILGQPSASYYPAYLQQSENNTESKLSQRQVSFHVGEGQTLRGFKRYPVQTQVPLQPPMPQLEKDIAEYAKVSSKLLPMKEGALFKGKIRFHNLHPREIQLLCWLLTWGGDTTLSHSLGMAKPYGYGAVKTRIIKMQLEANASPGEWQDCTSQVAQKTEEFERWIETATGNTWKSSATMQELLAMAKGIPASNANIQYMELKHHAASKANDSKTNRNNGYALPTFTSMKK